MPFARPTLTQIRDGLLADVAAQQIYDNTTGLVVNPLLLQFDPLTIMAKVLAGAAYELYGYLDYIALQATPATATDAAALAWGALKNITPKAATAASATLTGSSTLAASLPAGTVFARSDGVTYASTAAKTITAGGSVTVPVTATTTGAATTLTAGAALTLQTSIAGVAPSWTVTAATAPGTDVETQAAFKARYLAAYASPPAGGALTDYQEWALAVPGVTRAWAIGGVNGAGTVGVYVMLDVAEATNSGFPVGTNGISPNDNSGTPRATLIATGDQLTVANAIVAFQPVTALVYVLAPTASPITFTIANLGAANTAANQAAISAALATACVSIGTPLGQTIDPSVWNSAIISVLGSANFTLSSPTAPVVIASGALPTVGSVTYSA